MENTLAALSSAPIARPKRKIIAFHQDEHADWVADLECGHTQHVRHHPPWTLRPWVRTPEGHAAHLGMELLCSKCMAT